MSPKSKGLEPALRSRRDGRLGYCGLLLLFRLLGRLSAFADIDAALEKRAVFNRDARRHHITRQRTIAADVHAVAGGQVATYLAEHNDFARINVRRHYTISAYGHPVA